jgi:hypothetical protein
MTRKPILLVLIPWLTLAGCSGQDSPAVPPERAAPRAGAGPSLDGPMLATPGLWKTTTTANGQAAFGAIRTCVDAASQKADALAPDGGEAGCSPPQRRPVAGGFAYDLVCEQQGLKTVVNGEVRGDARHVVMTSTSRMTGPDGDTLSSATVVVESTFLGPCPAGMKPGDFVQDGASTP